MIKKNILLFFITVLLLLQANFICAQVPERCGTEFVRKIYEQKNPQVAADRKAFNQAAENIIRAKRYKTLRSMVTIPVVVHVI